MNNVSGSSLDEGEIQALLAKIQKDLQPEINQKIIGLAKKTLIAVNAAMGQKNYGKVYKEIGNLLLTLQNYGIKHPYKIVKEQVSEMTRILNSIPDNNGGS